MIEIKIKIKNDLTKKIFIYDYVIDFLISELKSFNWPLALFLLFEFSIIHFTWMNCFIISIYKIIRKHSNNLVWFYQSTLYGSLLEIWCLLAWMGSFQEWLQCSERYIVRTLSPPLIPNAVSKQISRDPTNQINRLTSQ